MILEKRVTTPVRLEEPKQQMTVDRRNMSNSNPSIRDRYTGINISKKPITTGKRIKKIGNKFYDIGTDNLSFLQVAQDLKTLGIENFYFMLEVIDPYVVTLNPFSENLSYEQITRITNEIVRNPWYFAREIYRIPTVGGAPVRYKANRGNMAQLWCTLHGIDNWLNLPRQQGKTVGANMILNWAYSFGTNNNTFILLNKSGEDSKVNLNRIYDAQEVLPEYLQFKSIIDYDDERGKTYITKEKKNATSLTHPITKNVIMTKAKANNYEKALVLARGLTSSLIHSDETEFTPFIKTIVENSYPTFDTASRIARENGSIYARIFTSTPGDLDTQPAVEAEKILDKTCRFTEKMYDMEYDPNDDNCELKQYVKSNGGNGIVYIEFSYKQLGLTDEWAREMYDKIDNPTTYKREVLLQRLHGSSDSPFDQDDIEYIISKMRSVKKELFLLDVFRLDIYDEIDKKIPYIVGVDCSTGTMGDDNAITILNPYTVKPVAEFACPFIGETKYEELIIELVRKVIPRAIVCIERNSMGDGIIDHLLHSPIKRNLYYSKNKDLIDDKITSATTVESLLKKHAVEKKFYGVYTEKNSREDMMLILHERVREHKNDFVTANITKDLSRLVKTKTGKIVAGEGFHDDSIMSYLICLYIYYHGDNLRKFGFNKGATGLDISADNRQKDMDEILRDINPYELNEVLPSEVVENIKEKQAYLREAKYEEILRNAILQNQTESMAMHKKQLVDNRIIANTPNDVLDDYEVYSSFDDNMDLAIFDEFNDL